MARTLLQIIVAAQQELGLPQATTVIGNSDVTTNQLLGFAQSEIEALRKKKENGWTALQTLFNLVVAIPLETTGDTTDNSAVITNIPSTATISVDNFIVQGEDIPVAARILSVDSATQVTMNMVATGTAVGVDLLFAKDTYALPADFDHYINRTMWDRTNRWELIGPDSPQIDQWHQSGIVTTGPRRHWRQLNKLTNKFRLWPPPAEITSPLQLVFEYISKYSVSVQGSAVNFAELWANDADICVLDDRAIIMGIKWRFWEQKGFNWLSKRDEYDRFVDTLIAQDGGALTLSLVRRSDPFLLSPNNVQDGFFPGPTGPNMS